MTLSDIESDIYQKGSVNREHVLEFLRLQNTSDSQTIRSLTRQWLIKLRDDPKYSKILFPEEGPIGNGIDRILDDLDNYGIVTPQTVIDAPAVEL